MATKISQALLFVICIVNISLVDCDNPITDDNTWHKTCPDLWVTFLDAYKEEYYRASHEIYGKNFSFCYLLQVMDGPETFLDAETRCKQKLPGSNLVSIHSQREYEFVMRYVFGGGMLLYNYPVMAWIGLQRHQQMLFPNTTVNYTQMKGMWTWSDGTLLNYNDWYQGDKILLPPGDCAIMIPPNPWGNGTWLPVACDMKWPYVCKADYFKETRIDDKIHLNLCDKMSPCYEGKCSNSPGTLKCECEPGQAAQSLRELNANDSLRLFDSENDVVTRHLITYNCQSFNECAGMTECDENARCEDNGPAEYNCTCIMGYSGNGTFCSDVDECVTREADPCQSMDCALGSVGKCFNEKGTYTCECVQREGYWIYPFSVVFVTLVIVATVAMAAYMLTKWLRRKQRKKKMSLARSDLSWFPKSNTKI